MQVVNVYLCRSRRRSIFSRPLFENRLIMAGIAAELALIVAIDYTAAGNAVFGTVPIGADVWSSVLPFAASMLAVEEGRKFIVRWREGASNISVRTHSARLDAAGKS
jgi:magnesium-transporting ATPase (P-type)